MLLSRATSILDLGKIIYALLDTEFRSLVPETDLLCVAIYRWLSGTRSGFCDKIRSLFK